MGTYTHTLKKKKNKAKKTNKPVFNIMTPHDIFTLQLIMIQTKHQHVFTLNVQIGFQKMCTLCYTAVDK